MPQAVRFDHYGGVDVLDVVDVDAPERRRGPGRGARARPPASTPARRRSARARCTSAGPRPSRPARAATSRAWSPRSGRASRASSVGDEVIGYTDNRASHAELAAVEAEHLTPRPRAVPWEVAGALYVVGATAYAAVRAVGLREGDVVAVSGAAGGVGTLVVQLARHAGATVVGLASEDHHDWLREHGAIPVTYGDGVAERIREAAGGRVDAFIDLYGSGYVELALELGVAPERIDTIADFDGARAPPGRQDRRQHGGASAETLAELAALIADGRLEVPIAARLPARRGPRGLHRARAPPHAREDRPAAVTDMTGR